MIVWVCRRVSDQVIRQHAQAGLDFEGIQAELGVSTQCGRCEPCARAVVQQCTAPGQASDSARVFPLRPAQDSPTHPLPLAA